MQADKAAWKAAKAALDEEAALAAEDNEDGMGYARSEMVLSQGKQRCSDAGAARVCVLGTACMTSQSLQHVVCMESPDLMPYDSAPLPLLVLCTQGSGGPLPL